MTRSPCSVPPPSTSTWSTPSRPSRASVSSRSTPPPSRPARPSRPWRRPRATRRPRRRGAAAVVITSVGASSVSNSGPVAGTRPRASSRTRQRLAQWACARRRGRSARAGRRCAVPAPTTIACESARSSCASARAVGGRDPLRRAVGGRDPTVDARSRPWPRRTGGRCAGDGDTARARARPRRRRRRRHDLDAGVAQPRDARARDPRIGVFERDDDARRRPRRSARRRTAACGRGCEQGSSVDVRGRAAGAIAGLLRARRPRRARRPGGSGARARRSRRRARARSRPRDSARSAASGGADLQRLLPSPRRRARSLAPDPVRGTTHGARRRRQPAGPPVIEARPPRTASRPSPIRTLTVGPGFAPGRRPAGGRAFAGLDLGPRARSSPPVGTFTQPRGLSLLTCTFENTKLRQNCNVFQFWSRARSEAPGAGDASVEYATCSSQTHHNPAKSDGRRRGAGRFGRPRGRRP